MVYVGSEPNPEGRREFSVVNNEQRIRAYQFGATRQMV